MNENVELCATWPILWIMMIQRNKQFILVKRARLLLTTVTLLFSGICAIAQTTVKGNVIAEDDGLPVIGASVFAKGSSTIGTVTDLDGNFTLEVPASVKSLVVSFMGYTDAEVAVAREVKVVLKTDSEMLEQVVVTGMQKMDRRLFTGAASKIDAEEAKLDGMPDISRSLEGRVAGVSVQNVSGTFGTAPKIRVRGATSIYGSSKPLWVVDGVIMADVLDISADDLSSGDANTLISSAIAGLNSDDIETFDILKDGSATSIYGARAMAGVIVVTTKKGRAGQSHISYTGEFTSRLKPSYRTFNIMNSQDQMDIYQELQQKGYLGYAGVSNAADSGIYGKMYELISQYDATSGQFGLANTDLAKAEYLRTAEYRNTDWFDYLFSSAIQQNHSVSISGGTEKSTYYASMSVMDDPGWTIQSSVKRYTANMNTTINISDKLSVGLISNASYRRQRAPGTLSQDVDVVFGEAKRDFDINPYSYALNTSRALDPNEYYTRNYAPFNIANELENNFISINVFDFRAQGEVKYKPVKPLEFSLLAAVKYSGSEQEHNILDNSNQAQAYRAMGTSTIRDNNSFLYKDPDKPGSLPISVLPDGGILDKTSNTMTGYDFRASMNFNKTFAQKHITNFYGGAEINSIDRHSTFFRGWGMQYSMGEVANYAYQVFKKGAEDNTEYFNLGNTFDRSIAFFGNGTYSYDARYTVNGTVRYEGTNKLGKSRSARWLPTWNVSGSWNISQEEWFEPVTGVISHLSLKSSYSLTADRGPASVTNSFVVISSETPWKPTAALRESALYIYDLANSDLTYEKKHELNVGVEAGFIDNRINATFDWYKRNNFDLIGLVNTQGVGGQVKKLGNIAAMKSNGCEFSLTTTNIKKKDFSWTTNFNYSHAVNRVTDLKTSTRVIDLIHGTGFAQEGYPVRSIFSIPFMGLDNEGLPTFLDQDGNITTTGIYFQESDPEKLGFLEYSGSADPTDFGSLGNIFTWKGFRLNVYMTYSFGNVIRLDPVFSNTYNDLDSMPKEFINRWMVPGNESKTDIPVIASKIQNKNDTDLKIAYSAYNYSTARIAKGDFIRMKEISFGYDFPKKVTDALKLNALSLKLQASNLFLIYADPKLNGQDPEFFNTGGVAVPVPKQFTFTVRLGI